MSVGQDPAQQFQRIQDWKYHIYDELQSAYQEGRFLPTADGSKIFGHYTDFQQWNQAAIKLLQGNKILSELRNDIEISLLYILQNGLFKKFRELSGTIYKDSHGSVALDPNNNPLIKYRVKGDPQDYYVWNWEDPNNWVPSNPSVKLRGYTINIRKVQRQVLWLTMAAQGQQTLQNVGSQLWGYATQKSLPAFHGTGFGRN